MEELTSKLNGDQWQPRPAGASQKAQKEASEGRTVIAGTLHPSESAQGTGAESTPATVRFAGESPVVPSLGPKLTAMQSAASSDSFGSSPRRQVGAEEPADLKGADKAFMSQLAGSSIGGAILTAAGRLFSPRSHPPPRQQSSGTPPASGAACSVQPTHATPEEVAAEIAASQSVAAVAIQACARGMLGRRRLARLASAALLSQRRWRWQRERVAILQLQQAARLLLMRRRAEVEQGLDAALSSGAAGRRHHRHSLLELEKVVKTDTDLLKHSGARPHRPPPPPTTPCPLHPRTSPAPLPSPTPDSSSPRFSLMRRRHAEPQVRPSPRASSASWAR